MTTLTLGCPRCPGGESPSLIACAAVSERSNQGAHFRPADDRFVDATSPAQRMLVPERCHALDGLAKPSSAHRIASPDRSPGRRLLRERLSATAAAPNWTAPPTPPRDHGAPGRAWSNPPSA